MENTTNEIVLTTENIVAITSILITVVIAIIGAIYAIITNTKKYELTENYRCEILSWYKSVSETMIDIIHYCESGMFYSENFSQHRTELLSKLSLLTEIGRFYFPNIIKNDEFGIEKPTAYQGYRHINLEFLLHFYLVAKDKSSNKEIELMWKLERAFTSFIFDMIMPRKRNKEYSKYLSIIIPKGQSIYDYVDDNPKNIGTFM